MSKSYFHKKYEDLAVLYANSQLALEGEMRERISCQKAYKKREAEIASYRRDLADAIRENVEIKNSVQEINTLNEERIKNIGKMRDELLQGYLKNLALFRKALDDLNNKSEATPCADSDTD